MPLGRGPHPQSLVRSSGATQGEVVHGLQPIVRSLGKQSTMTSEGLSIDFGIEVAKTPSDGAEMNLSWILPFPKLEPTRLLVLSLIGEPNRPSIWQRV